MPFLPPNQQRQSTEGNNSNFALAPISTLVRPALVTGFKQPLQINDFATYDMLPFIPLHFLCTHFWQLLLLHCNELSPMTASYPVRVITLPINHASAIVITWLSLSLIINAIKQWRIATSIGAVWAPVRRLNIHKPTHTDSRLVRAFNTDLVTSCSYIHTYIHTNTR